MTPQAMGRAPAIDFQLRLQVRSLRQLGYCVNDICHQLGLHKASERAAVQLICDAMPRRYQRGIEVGGPVLAGRSMARAVLV